jgi:hypothetical protein
MMAGIPALAFCIFPYPASEIVGGLRATIAGGRTAHWKSSQYGHIERS